jgi:hypothetical protein
VRRETGVTFAYPRQHGDPYVFPTGVAKEQGQRLCSFEDPVVRQPDPTEVLVVEAHVDQDEAAGAPGRS